MNILLNWIQPNSKFWKKNVIEKSFELNILGGKWYWIIFWIKFRQKWWKWIVYQLKVFNFCLFWTHFGHFPGTFLIRPVLMIPWHLDWIINWNESPPINLFEMNNCLNWILVRHYWIRFLILANFAEIQTLNWI